MNKKEFGIDFKKVKKGKIHLIRCNIGVEFFATDYYFVGRELKLVVNAIVEDTLRRVVIGSIDIGEVKEVY